MPGLLRWMPMLYGKQTQCGKFPGGRQHMLLRRGVHNPRRRASNAQAEERLHLSGVFGRWTPRDRRQHAVSRGQVGRGRLQRYAGDGSRALRSEGLHLGAGRHSDQLGTARRAGCAPDLLPDYEVSVGSTLEVLLSLEGRAEGDPRKIADVVVQLANSHEVPVRLLLGVDAEKRVQQAEAGRVTEAEKWRHLTVSTVFEDANLAALERLYATTDSGIDS